MSCLFSEEGPLLHGFTCTPGCNSVQVGCNQTGVSEIYSFKTAPALGPTWTPYKIAMWADVGQTMNSSVTLEHMVEAEADISILIGDLVYAVGSSPEIPWACAVDRQKHM